MALCISAVGAARESALGQGGDLYERGLALIEAGEVEAALELWADARDSLTGARAEDPRIGRAFVEAVAELGLAAYEELATEIFYWGLSTRTAGREPYRTEVLEEGRRTFVLVDSVVAQHWAGVGRDDPVALAMEIKRFWVERDPTPTTPVNERLLEHWRRVAEVRRKYTHNESSAFGTDDRGIFHVKYGKPDHVVNGTMSVSRWEQRMIGIPQVVVDRYDRFPLFEAWRYAGLVSRDFVYFLFGNEGGTGPFRHVEGVHELIPSGARSFNVTGSTTQTGGAIRGRRAVHYLEWAYYQDVASMGGPYGERSDELDRIWLGRTEPHDATMRATSFRYADTDRNALRQPRAPVLSPYEDSPKSVLSAQAARVILDGDEAGVMLLAVSSPLSRLKVKDGELADTVVFHQYGSRHTVIARNHNLHEVARADMQPLGGDGHTAQLVIRHAPSLAHLTVAVEHHPDGAEDQPMPEETDRDTIGVLPGHSHFSLGPPLARTPITSALSDLFVGIAPQPGLLPEEMPVPLLPAGRIWRDDLLRVYFEIYHPLGAAEGDTRLFDIQLRVLRRLPTADIDYEPEPRAAAITVALTSTAPSAAHHFDLDLRNEDPGPLMVVLRATDRTTGETYVRTAPIYLLEN